MRAVLAFVVVISIAWGLVMLSWAVAPDDDTFTPVEAATPLHGPDSNTFCCRP